MLEFFVLNHFFQFFTFLLFLVFIVFHFIIKSLLLKYPDMIIDGLSIFKIITYFFKKSSNTLKTSHDKIDLINEKYDEYNNKYDKIIFKLFYPIPESLLLSSIFSYFIYFLTNINSSIFLNLSILFISYFILKNIKIIN
jgi:hypothetical protein